MNGIYEINDEDLLIKVMKELINRNDIKILRRLLIKNKFCNELNTRKLNQEIQAKDYKFTKRNGIMTFVKSQYQAVKDKLDFEVDKLLNDILHGNKIKNE
ncbi:hypothetical protein M9Y10_021227 [Tritrichomonas musculus]|uniref:Uncharacterized protein n=1 Tax=Tritrichomonas musculus TaxID=1915356 RepID=A0ABR2HDH0_9EUKA